MPMGRILFVFGNVESWATAHQFMGDTAGFFCGGFFCVYRLKKESISKEMNNDSDLNLHSMTKLSGWLRY